MELPKLIERFVATQNNFDSKAFVECFMDTAIVHDEGKTYTGKEEIRQWIEDANEKYQTVTKPLNYEEVGSEGTLTAEVSGTFTGSPIVLQFHLGLKNNLIDSFRVTG
ncbi:nuclear transport factor 2 family protein [Mucilaginibacter defluvii]|uniref:Nuclear transport factor 2 family protein n=1 Tax=Mucilaginibacter defluvii TaxID=1196019 RepID=A0ABP9G1N0_9SPHI